MASKLLPTEPIWSTGTSAKGEYLSAGDRKAIFRKRKISAGGSPLKGGSIVPKMGGGLVPVSRSIVPSSGIASSIQPPEQEEEKIGSNGIFAELRDKIAVNAKKITIIKKTLQNHASTLGQKLPGSELDDISKGIQDIGNALSLDFANRIAEHKDAINKLKLGAKQDELTNEEAGLEKKRKSLFGGVRETAAKIMGPAVSMFDKIKEFLLNIFAGQLVTGAFDWLKDPKNQQALQGFFNWVQKHWKWIAGAAIVGASAIIIRKVMQVVKAIRGVVRFLKNGIKVALSIFKYGPKIGKLFKRAVIAAGGKQVAKKIFGKQATKAVTKQVTKEVGEQVTKKVVTKSLTKVATKQATKGIGKSLLKKIPFVGLGMGIIFAVDRLRKGDWGGALLEVASGAASTIPGVGTGVSLALDAALIAKDVSEARSITGGDKIDAERKIGGPITKGQNVLVGEGGPEVITASFTGTVQNAHKTAQMISQDMGASEINMVPMDLGTIKTPPPELPKVASPTPNEPTQVNSINPANPYMMQVPELLGIDV